MKHFTSTLSKITASAIAVLAAQVVLHATPVTVTELGIGANETVWIDSSTLGNNLNVYAGVVKLNVNGVAMDGFCIDPWHWSGTGPLAYNQESLAAAPKSANNTSTVVPMGATAALEISQLWTHYYSTSISNSTAAALQIEIWKIVDAAVTNGTFHLDSIDGGDSATVLSTMSAMEAFLASNPSAAAANLVAVTGPGQDYVILAPAPDSAATAALIGGAFLGLVGMRRRFARV
jgi:hypothetical protein